MKKGAVAFKISIFANIVVLSAPTKHKSVLSLLKEEKNRVESRRQFLKIL